MQPKTLALIVSILPLVVMNLAYVLSANAEFVPSCIPYIDGCTSISRAARRGDSLFIFRATMIVQAVLLMIYWRIAWKWLELLSGKPLISAKIMCGLGVIAALFLILYADFLGTDGQVYRYMRRYGIVFFFTLTPFAQMLMVNQLFKLKQQQLFSAPFVQVMRYQLAIVASILAVGLVSLGLSYSGNNTFERENITEWNYAVLISIFHLGSYFQWQEIKIKVVLMGN